MPSCQTLLGYECDGLEQVAQGGLRELPKPVRLLPSCLHIPGCPRCWVKRVLLSAELAGGLGQQHLGFALPDLQV